MSFFKDFNSENVGGEPNLVSCLRTAYGYTLEEALERVTGLAIDSWAKLFSVLGGMEPKIRGVIQGFIYGFVTWHFIELRYCFAEVYEGVRNGQLSDDPVKERFCE